MGIDLLYNKHLYFKASLQILGHVGLYVDAEESSVRNKLEQIWLGFEKFRCIGMRSFHQLVL